MNVATLLDARCAERPYQRAVVVPVRQGDRVSYAHITFGELRRRIDATARGLTSLGLGRGDRVSVFLRPGLDFPVAVFALFKLGCAPVFIDPGMGRDAVMGCLQRMAPKGLVAVPELHALRPLFRSALSSVSVNVSAGTGWWGAARLDALMQTPGDPVEPLDLDPDEEEAAILFTSGSTGPAKGAVYTHRIFTAQTRHIQAMYGLEPGEIDVPALPTFGLFSLAMGMTIAIPEIDASRPASLDPARLVDLIDDLGATNAFGSIAIWKPVARYCQETGRELGSLRRVLSAGTSIPVELHQTFASILRPGVEIHTPYGATESLPVATIGGAEVLADTAARTLAGAGTCVGRPAPGIEIRAIRIEDGPIPTWSDELCVAPGEVGEICVRGEVVTQVYRGDEAATALAKIRDGSTIWHRIGDLGSMDDQGRLWFCGRKAHRVQTPAGPMFADPCEETLNQAAGVARTALVGLGAPGEQEPAIVVELALPDADRVAVAAAVRALAASHAHTRPITRVLFHPSFPVDIRHNAKINREILATHAAGRIASRPRLGLPGEEDA